MNVMLRLSLVCVILSVLAGCATPEARIKQKPEVFSALSPELQEKVRAGKVEVGFTKDMVYIALGDPDRRYLRTTAEGEVEVWAFVDTYSTVERQRVDGPFRYRDVDGSYRTSHDSVWVDVQQRHEYERLRVEFRDGVVTAIEKMER